MSGAATSDRMYLDEVYKWTEYEYCETKHFSTNCNNT